MRTRPQTVTIAAILLALLSLANFLAPLMLPAEAGAVVYLIIMLGVWASLPQAGCGCSRAGLCG